MLSNFDIDGMLDSLDTFAGVFSRDKMPTVDNKRKKAARMNGECGVVNLDNDSGPGTHWVCYIVDKNLPFAFYFDSFGLAPPKEVVDYLKRLVNKPLSYNSSQIQNITSILCGYYCVYVLKTFYRSKRDSDAVYDILYSFEQQPDQFNENKMLTIFSEGKI